MAERSIATDCKSVALTGYPGSNPGPDTMKAFLLGIGFLVLVAAGGFVYLKYFYPSAGKADQKSFTTAPVSKRGVLQKTNVPGSNFTHVLVAAGESVGVASYSLNLDDYIGKNVEVTGQYSGTTLYADTVTVLP